MFNNAGIVGVVKTDMVEVSMSEFEDVVRVNLVGAFLGTKHAARVMETCSTRQHYNNFERLWCSGRFCVPCIHQYEAWRVRADEKSGCRARTVWHSCELRLPVHCRN